LAILAIGAQNTILAHIQVFNETSEPDLSPLRANPEIGTQTLRSSGGRALRAGS
jgi:hypothetical protein